MSRRSSTSLEIGPPWQKLNQIIAVSKGVKSETLRALTDAHRDVQKQPLLSGISRTYQPKDDEGERLPSESTKVQLTATA